MKAEDIKTARKIVNTVNSYEGPEKIILTWLLRSRDCDAGEILTYALNRFGMTSWIEAGLNCKKDEDVVAEALADFFTDREPEVINAGNPE